MAFYRQFLVVSMSLAVWAWCLAGASAQEPQSTQPDRAGSRLGVPQPLGNIVLADEVIERRYKVEAISFKAVDESGYDWWSSDDVVVETLDAKGETSSKEIEDVDSGDVHHFDPAKSCVVAVREGQVVLGESSVCDSAGEPAPFWFLVKFWENDDNEILAPFTSAECSVGENTPGRHCSASPKVWADFLGNYRGDFSQQDLDALLPNIGDEHVRTVTLFSCRYPATSCIPEEDSDYNFTYRITRLPDVKLKLGK